ncbi:YbaN family protein [Thalassobaculum salexigens]|uniref:YbaN family protein n=1 Tax=Thalassobaculum salexigens TaxID=455360 RepID=UPI000418B6A4|nr:YbaN family protein [Thalassobaculum salexigens]
MTQNPADTAPRSTDETEIVLPAELCGAARLGLQIFGFVCLAIGIAGVILPGLPGTVFLIVALWAFSRSSHRLHLWLYSHPRFGAGLRAWHRHRVIPTKAKIAAVAAMTLAAAMLIAAFPSNAWIPGTSIAVMVAVAAWIVTRPGRIADPS